MAEHPKDCNCHICHSDEVANIYKADLESNTERIQAERFNTNKPKLSFILDFPRAITEVCRVAEMGAEKYNRNNWKKGLLFTEVEDSLLRHLLDFHNGRDMDEESGLETLAHAVWNGLALLEQNLSGAKYRTDFDNRNVPGTTCAHGKAFTDYCEPCGRINNAS
jgi:hypothetical protein